MTESSINLADLAILATIAAAVFGIISTALRWLMAYIEAKFGKPDMTIAEQSAQCHYDHNSMQTSPAPIPKTYPDPPTPPPHSLTITSPPPGVCCPRVMRSYGVG